MCALFYENRLGIKKIVISFVYVFCPNTGTKFREPYHSNHVIPHRVYVGQVRLSSTVICWIGPFVILGVFWSIILLLFYF